MDPVHPIIPGTPIFREIGKVPGLRPVSRDDRGGSGGGSGPDARRREPEPEPEPDTEPQPPEPTSSWDRVERRQHPRDDDGSGPHIDISA